MRRPLPLVALALCSVVVAAPARAHEPLWGETPIVFGFGIVHPEARFEFSDAGSPATQGGRVRMFEQEYMVQYGLTPKLNIALEIPYLSNLHEQLVGGRLHRAGVAGLGDIGLHIKSRLSARQGVGLSVQQSILYGLKLPTGRDDAIGPDGERLEPHHQPGTGNLGVRLGYMWDRETTRDTTWASFRWSRDLGGGFRMGDMAELDVAYGYWLRPQNEAADLGLMTALGAHAEWHADDPVGRGRTADDGHFLLGVQLTQMVIRGASQLRIGAMMPLARRGDPSHTGFPVQFRIAFETFF
jgi:hypothetical protein